MILNQQTIPCIMHLENRVRKKLIPTLLAFGAEIFQKQHGLKSLMSYANGVQYVVNTTLLGIIG